MSQSTMAEEPLIQIRNLHFSRGSRAIFKGINLDIRRGQVTAVMGPSGTGKTTLLRLLGGQLKPDQGEIMLAGEGDIGRMRRKALFRIRRHIGMLFQSGALFTDMTVFENVAFPLRVHTTLDERLLHDVVMMKLEAVGLRGAAGLMPAELSGGMTRRVALARAIATDPRLMMYDEPFVGQDPISMGVLVQLVRRLNDALGLTSIVVSHDLAETMSIADYAYVIADGQVLAEGTPEALQQDQAPEVRQFIEGLPDGPVPFHYPASPYRDELLGEVS